MAVQSYQEKEQSLYSDLTTLIKDAAWLRHYIASALKVQGDALLGAAGALGENTRPDTSVSMSGLSLGSKGTQGTASTNTAQPSTQHSGDTEKKSHANDAEIETQPSGSPPAEQVPATSDGTSNPFLSSGVIPQ